MLSGQRIADACIDDGSAQRYRVPIPQSQAVSEPSVKKEVSTYGNCTATLVHGDALACMKSLADDSVDLMLCSPPYFVGKSYDISRSIADFAKEIRRVRDDVERIVRPGGSVCWQVGNHVSAGMLTPLDAIVFGIFAELPSMILRNRIVWTFGHGVHANTRFSGRHETVLWYTKGGDYKFNLDAIRVPQKYPGKRYYKGPRRGEWSGNPLGKNPGDVWEIPNVKARHVEKTAHPCQFPSALSTRLILALTDVSDLVFDPYMGSGTTGVSALHAARNFIGSELDKSYIRIAQERISALGSTDPKLRPDRPTRTPRPGEAVSTIPPHFLAASGSAK